MYGTDEFMFSMMTWVPLTVPQMLSEAPGKVGITDEISASTG